MSKRRPSHDGKASATTLTVATYNIRWVLDYWERRWSLVKDAVVGAVPGKPDIVAFQEVCIGGGLCGQDALLSEALPSHRLHTAAMGREYLLGLWPMSWLLGFISRLPFVAFIFDLVAWLNQRFYDRVLGPYAMKIYYTPCCSNFVNLTTGAAFVFGLATATRAALDDGSRVVLLLGEGKAAMATRVRVNDVFIWIVNVHAASGVAKGTVQIRAQQAKAVVEWLSDKRDPQMVLGDLNAGPEEPLHAVFRKAGFRSAHAVAHGREPLKTFHQQHECPSKDVEPENCLDYIYFKGSALTLAEGKTAVRVFGTEPCKVDAKLYPSDHFGLAARFHVTRLQEKGD